MKCCLSDVQSNWCFQFSGLIGSIKDGGWEPAVMINAGEWDWDLLWLWNCHISSSLIKPKQTRAGPLTQVRYPCLTCSETIYLPYLNKRYRHVCICSCVCHARVITSQPLSPLAVYSSPSLPSLNVEPLPYYNETQLGGHEWPTFLKLTCDLWHEAMLYLLFPLHCTVYTHVGPK